MNIAHATQLVTQLPVIQTLLATRWQEPKPTYWTEYWQKTFSVAAKKASLASAAVTQES